MKYRLELDEADVRQVLADRYGVTPADIRIDHHEADPDPRCYTQASVTFEISSVDPIVDGGQ